MSSFYLVVRMGPIGLLLLTYLVQVSCSLNVDEERGGEE